MGKTYNFLWRQWGPANIPTIKFALKHSVLKSYNLKFFEKGMQEVIVGSYQFLADQLKIDKSQLLLPAYLFQRISDCKIPTVQMIAVV